MNIKTRLANGAAWFFAGLIVVIAGVIMVALNYDWNRARPWINAQVSQKIGRPFAIEGPLSLSWSRSHSKPGWQAYLPWPRFTAETIKIGNPAWTKKPHLATLEKASFEVELLPLLHQEVVIPAIALTNPSINLERTPNDQVNWNLNLSEPSSQSNWTINLDELTFSAGHLFFSDQKKQIEANIIIAPIGNTINLDELQNARKQEAVLPLQEKMQDTSQSTVSPAYAFAFTLSGTFKEAPIKGSGKIGGVLSLMNASRAFPLQADMRLGDNHIVLEGTLSNPAQLAALDMQLRLSANSMAHLYDLTGVTLPETPPFTTHGHLTARLDKKHQQFNYENFTGKVGSSDLTGTLRYTVHSPRPLLSGTVKSKKLVFVDLAPLIGADSNKKKKLRGARPQNTNQAVPEEPFRTERWKAMDADVVFTGEQIIRDPALPISNMHTHLIMKEGVLTLKPLRFGVAGGTLSGNIHLDGSRVPLKGNFSIAARQLRLKQLFPTFDLMRSSIGQVNGDAELAAVGNSPAAWAATSNGEVKIVLNEGRISSTLLEQAGLNVANIVIAKLFGDKTVQINCAAAHFVVKQGLLDSRIFALDTEDALINVNGTVNLANERMNLDVTPHTKGFRIFSLRSPLYVKGTFKDPNIGVAPGPLIARGGGAIVLGMINPVASLLALIVPPTHPDTSPCVGLLKELPAKPSKKPAQTRKAKRDNAHKQKSTKKSTANPAEKSVNEGASH